MERYVYVNGAFLDRVSNSAEEIAKYFDAEIIRVDDYACSVCGSSEKVYLVKPDFKGNKR